MTMNMMTMNDDGGVKCGPFTNSKKTMCLTQEQGLYYCEDNALLVDVFDENYNEKHFSSILSEATCD